MLSIRREPTIMKRYTLQIPKAIEQRLGKCRGSMRRTIAERLGQILDALTPADRHPQRTSPLPQGPPLRFYVLEGYRISYRVNTVAQRVIVIDLQPASG